MRLLEILLFLSSFCLNIFAQDEVPIIETKCGKVSGIVKKSYEGKSYNAYMGIPFAENPTGDLRFEVSL